MAKMTPAEAMKLALVQGRNGAGLVSPNPLVGCVILSSENELLSSGYHARVGGDHAEVAALKNIKDKNLLKGAKVFVTLEPCAHEGRTPSCAKHLATLPIAQVTYGIRDPNPMTAGQGAEILRAAGIEVCEAHDFQGECEELAEIFLLNIREKRPFIALKIASSLDGKVALEDGESQWITGEESRNYVQSLRGEYDALLTGVGTILKDNPKLNSRDPRFADKSQKLVILDPEGHLRGQFSKLNIGQVRKPEDIFWVTTSLVKSEGEGVTKIVLPLENGQYSIAQLSQILFEKNIFSVFVEAGGQTVSSFLSQKSFDRMYLFVAPRVLGRGLSWTDGLKIPSLDQSVDLGPLHVQSLGLDLLISARRPTSGPKSK